MIILAGLADWGGVQSNERAISVGVFQNIISVLISAKSVDSLLNSIHDHTTYISEMALWHNFTAYRTREYR